MVHDELDLLPGQAKLKLGGSHAGHNGLRDIHAQLGTGDYWRLRLGIGHPGVKSEVVELGAEEAAAEQREAIEDAIARTLQALPGPGGRRDGQGDAAHPHEQAAAAQTAAARARRRGRTRRGLAEAESKGRRKK